MIHLDNYRCTYGDSSTLSLSKTFTVEIKAVSFENQPQLFYNSTFYNVLGALQNKTNQQEQIPSHNLS